MMLLILAVSLAFAFVGGHMAEHRGRSLLSGVMLGGLLGVVGLLIIAMRGRPKVTA